MNAGKIIKLTDGTTIEAKMNFGTIFYLDQIGGSKLGRRIEINWAEYMVDAREMGMTEDEFFHSCPVFFCEQYEIFCEKKARKVRTLYGG